MVGLLRVVWKTIARRHRDLAQKIGFPPIRRTGRREIDGTDGTGRWISAVSIPYAPIRRMDSRGVCRMRNHPAPGLNPSLPEIDPCNSSQ
jgi:hypothetical protein